MMRKIPPLFFLVAAFLTPAWAAADDVPLTAVGKSVRQEFGSVRHDYFTLARVSDQVVMGLGIPNPQKPVADGNVLISGCRRHSCDEKSAVIATPAGLMLAAGLIYFRCPGDMDKTKAAADCKLAPYLKIFVKLKNDRPAFEQELKGWAAHQGYTGAAEKEILRP